MPKIEAATALVTEPSIVSVPRPVVEPGALLGNGRWTVAVTARGTGFAAHGATLLTGWAGDAIEDRDGVFFYLRDLDTREWWSAALEPVPGGVGDGATSWRPGVFTIERREHGIESRLDITVAPGADAELRRLTLRNRTRRARRIEITSYAAIALHHPAAHAAHPAFSKLFVQTEFVPAAGALLVRRRPRDPAERHPWLAHTMIGAGKIEHETDRHRFIGRGGSLRAPRALTVRGALSGTTGNVLDPIVSLRRVVRLAPGASAEVCGILGAAADRDAALALAQMAGLDVEATFAAAEKHARARLEESEVAPEAEERRQALAVAVLYGRASVEPTNGAPASGVKVARPESLTTRAHRLAFATDGVGPNGVSVAPAHSIAAHENGAMPRRRPPRAPARAPKRTARPRAERLQFFNGYGGFSVDGTEYVIRLPHVIGKGLRLPPAPWINVLANERFGALVSETGAGYTWSENSRERRVTPWSNDPLLDPHGEAFYVRDEATGEFWSPLPGPAPAAADYEMAHGFGYSRCRHASHGLEQTTDIFVSAYEPVKVVRMRLRNTGSAPRRLSLFAYQQLVLGVDARDHARSVSVEHDAGAGILLAHNANPAAFGNQVAFAAAVVCGDAVTHVTRNRAAFLGPYGDPSDPLALSAGGVLENVASGAAPCFAQQVVNTLPAGGSITCAFLLGAATNESVARELVEHFRGMSVVPGTLAEAQAIWIERLSAVRIRTPRPALDLMVNGWLAYQTLVCRLWGRSAFYQSGGAYGFRDQLQDAAALTMWDPDILRRQILLHAEHQFVEGDVLHWWHPPDSRGIRTRFADDLLWLPWLTAGYVAATGDRGVLDERAHFVEARPLEPGEDEAFLVPQRSSASGDVYEHCCRAIDRSLATGAHGLPLFGTGDWNDGMNRVGREGKGESVWMGFFLYAVLGDFLPLCERRSDGARIERYREHRERLRVALNAGGWDGAWYRRAYYDDGTPLGTRDGDECRIDALAQAWAVMSGAAPRARARRAMDAVEQNLVSERKRIIRLLDPPFEHTPHDPGYIKGYVPGVRENGGQYTHAALWVVRALAELGRNDRAAKLLEMLSPVSHARTPKEAANYRVEPYVIAADVYGAPPHVGRGGWTWYTGSSGWMLRVALESVLGIRLEGGDTLVIDPRVPDGWSGFEVSWRVPGDATTYEIRVRNPKRRARRVKTARLDDARANVTRGVARIPIARDGQSHRIDVVLG